uniref:DDE Tnp4 domain-containing protein n=1 Tax=Knipowitschia caucasica TaxID=637954 RepID=A0AAV2LJ00_KNICA
MVARWQILGRPLEALPEKATTIVKACVVLHNYLTYTDEGNTEPCRYITPSFVDVDTVGQLQEGEWRRVTAGSNGLENLAPPSANPCTVHTGSQGCAIRSHRLFHF